MTTNAIMNVHVLSLLFSVEYCYSQPVFNTMQSCRICQSVSLPDGIENDLNQALVILGLVLNMFVVFVSF